MVVLIPCRNGLRVWHVLVRHELPRCVDEAPIVQKGMGVKDDHDPSRAQMSQLCPKDFPVSFIPRRVGVEQ